MCSTQQQIWNLNGGIFCCSVLIALIFWFEYESCILSLVVNMLVCKWIYGITLLNSPLHNLLTLSSSYLFILFFSGYRSVASISPLCCTVLINASLFESKLCEKNISRNFPHALGITVSLALWNSSNSSPLEF